MNNINTMVSVITPCYNGARFISRVINCVKNQDFDLELIIVNDCSTDNSWDILLELSSQYDWIKLISLERNSGPIIARNMAIKSARGNFLAFLDADDFWLPNKLAIQVKFMEEHNATLSFTDYRFISEDGSLVGNRISGFNKIGWNLHHMTRYLGCLTIMVDREKVPGFQFPDISPAYRAEDFLAWSNIIQKTGPALRCPQDLARYAQVANSRSSLGFKAAKSVWQLYRGVEKIPLVKAILYFIAYVFFAFFKRSFCRPMFKSSVIDGELSKKYLLGISE